MRKRLYSHFIRCGACCFLRGICVLRGCSIICMASRSSLLKLGRSDPKHVTVVRGNLLRRSGVDLPRETVESFPCSDSHYSHPLARFRSALPHRDLDRSILPDDRCSNDRLHRSPVLFVSTINRSYICTGTLFSRGSTTVN